jgi:hypothetical protein
VPLAVGTNFERGHNSTRIGSVHAEHNAITKLRPLKKSSHNKKCKRVDIVVIRLNTVGKLGASKPCSHCVRDIHEMLPRKGYVADNVYYSDASGEMIKTRATRLLFDPDVRPSCFYQNHNAHKIERKLHRLRKDKWTPYASSDSSDTSETDDSDSETVTNTVSEKIEPMMTHEARRRRYNEYKRLKRYHAFSR